MRCFKLLITLSVSLLLFIQTTLGCNIVLKKSTVVLSNNILIKDIASLYPKKLADVKISPAPFANNSITLTRQYVEFMLKQKGVKANVCGAETVKVLSRVFIVNRNIINKIIGKGNIIVTPLPIYLPYGKYKFKLQSISYSDRLKFFSIEAIRNGRVIKNITIAVERKKKGVIVPVARKDIEVGEIISNKDITYERLSNIPPNILLSKSDILRRVAINFIPRGSTFSTANTRRFRPVKMGDIVNVEVISGNIKIDTVAKALKSGYKGDIIPIMYLSSRRIVSAVVVGNKKVMVR